MCSEPVPGIHSEPLIAFLCYLCSDFTRHVHTTSFTSWSLGIIVINILTHHLIIFNSVEMIFHKHGAKSWSLVSVYLYNYLWYPMFRECCQAMVGICPIVQIRSVNMAIALSRNILKWFRKTALYNLLNNVVMLQGVAYRWHYLWRMCRIWQFCNFCIPCSVMLFFFDFV